MSKRQLHVEKKTSQETSIRKETKKPANVGTERKAKNMTCINKGDVAGSVLLGQKTSLRKKNENLDLHKTKADANDSCTSKNKSGDINQKGNQKKQQSLFTGLTE